MLPEQRKSNDASGADFQANETFATLETIIGNPDSLIFLERFVDRGSYHKFALYSEVTQRFRPVDGDINFSLPYLSVPSDQLTFITLNPDRRIIDWIRKDDAIKFFVHPDMVDVHSVIPARSIISPENFEGSITAAPTASTRTMLVNADGLPQFMIKTDLEKTISRFVRELDKTRVQYSLEISDALEEAANNPSCPSSVGFLPETVGAYLEFADGHSIGYLVRELNPRPTGSVQETLIPFFALFSPNKANPNSDLLIYQLLENIMRKKQISDPSEALLQYVFKQCLESWSFLAYNYGLLPERHAQNGLIAIDDEGIPTRIIDRDFQGFNVDLTTRKSQGLSTNFSHHVIEPEKRGVILSRCYDHRMGFQVFDPILEAVEQRYGSGVKVRTQEAIKIMFHQLTPSEFLDAFPKEQYGLDNTTMFGDQPTADVAKLQPPQYR